MNLPNWLLTAGIVVLGGVCAWVAVEGRRRRRRPLPYNGRHRAAVPLAIEPIPDLERTQPIRVGPPPVPAFEPMTYRVTACAPPVAPAALPAGPAASEEPIS